jgi:PhnB protein
MIGLTPFLLFDGTCADAMAFYRDCLGGELSITRLGDTPMRDGAPSELHERVVYAHLRCDAMELNATDWLHPVRVPRSGNTVGIYISGDGHGDDRFREIFDSLSVGADPELLDGLREEPFGTYGHLADRYGVHWFFRWGPSGPDELGVPTGPAIR